MPFSGKIGDTLRLRDPGARHRYFILTNPNENGDVVIVNITTAKHLEWSVTFSPKDNKELFTKKCTPNYNDARLFPLKALTYIAEQHPQEYCFCPENLTQRIVIGALQSRHTSFEIKDELGREYPEEYEKYFSSQEYLLPPPC